MSKRQHLFSVTKKDLEIQTFRSGGPGGQHQNKTNSGVRIIHKASGAVAESREERHQHMNKKIAFKRLIEHPKFKVWLMRMFHESVSGESIEEKVEKSMSEDNLRVEVKDEKGKWIIKRKDE